MSMSDIEAAARIEELEAENRALLERHRSGIAAAVAAEREACAQLVSNWPGRLGAELVAAIRARGGE